MWFVEKTKIGLLLNEKSHKKLQMMKEKMCLHPLENLYVLNKISTRLLHSCHYQNGVHSLGAKFYPKRTWLTCTVKGWIKLG